MESDHIFYYKPKLIILQHNGLLMLIKSILAFCKEKDGAIKRYYWDDFFKQVFRGTVFNGIVFDETAFSRTALIETVFKLKSSFP